MALVLLLLAHFVADFLLQPRWMGTQKSSKIPVLLAHCAIQFAIVFLFLLPWYPGEAFAVAALNTLVHGVVDWYIWNIYKFGVVIRNPETHPDELKKTWKYWEDHWFYATIGFDQLLHTLTLVGLYFLLLRG